jgi:hypothetical protein
MNQFKLAVEMYCKGIDIVNVGCAGSECEYSDGDEDHQCESSFSWSQCDSCGTSLGGDRHPGFMCWQDEADNWQDIAVELCTDCVMYHANGDVPEEVK